MKCRVNPVRSAAIFARPRDANPDVAQLETADSPEDLLGGRKRRVARKDVGTESPTGPEGSE